MRSTAGDRRAAQLDRPKHRLGVQASALLAATLDHHAMGERGDGEALDVVGHEKFPAVPIYMITGWGNEFSSADSRPSAVDGVLAKPLDVRELRSAIAKIASSPAEHPG